MKRRELLTHAGKVAAAALVAPLLPLGTIPLKPAGLTTSFVVTFDAVVHEYMMYGRVLAPAEIADVTAYLEKKYATA